MDVFLNDKYAQYLKSDLCVKLGFCSMGEKFDEILSIQPIELSVFIDKIFNAEGLNPELADKELLRQVKERIISVQQDFQSRDSG